MNEAISTNVNGIFCGLKVKCLSVKDFKFGKKKKNTFLMYQFIKFKLIYLNFCSTRVYADLILKIYLLEMMKYKLNLKYHKRTAFIYTEL